MLANEKRYRFKVLVLEIQPVRQSDEPRKDIHYKSKLKGS